MARQRVVLVGGMPLADEIAYFDTWLPAVAVSNAAGFAATPNLALPLDVTLRGLTLYAQAFVVDPQGPVLGLAFSAGRRLVLGD